MSNSDGKSSINVKRLVMFKQLTDSEAGTTYETEAHAFPNELNSAKYTPKMQTAEQYGDGVKAEDYVAKDGGTIDVTIRGYKPGDNAFLFGERQTAEGTEISSASDIVPHVCVAYMTERPDGKVNLYKFPKVTWTPQGEDAKQREGTSVSYGTASMSGTYSPLISTGEDKYTRYGVDPKTENDFIEDWFAKPDFYGTTPTDGGADTPGETA